MSCGSSKPLANEINAATYACQLIGGTTLEEARLHLGRTVNYLVGPGREHYDRTLGGMHYEPTEGHGGEDEGLGRGIIPDLEEVQKPTRRKYSLEPAAAALALEVAKIARDQAVKGLNDAKALEDAQAIHKLKQSAKIVSSLMQAALEVVLV